MTAQLVPLRRSLASLTSDGRLVARQGRALQRAPAPLPAPPSLTMREVWLRHRERRAACQQKRIAALTAALHEARADILGLWQMVLEDEKLDIIWWESLQARRKIEKVLGK